MKLIALSLIAAFLTSCAAYRSTIDHVTDNENLIAPAVALVTSIVFEKAVSEEDKVEKAKIIQNLAEKLIAVELTAKPTKEEFQTMILDALPGKTHWVTLAAVLATKYDSATKNISSDDVAKTVAVIREISIGLQAATARYVD